MAKSNDVFSYEPELIATLTNALCFKQLEFPFREKDPEVFAETIGTFVSGVIEQKKKLAKTKRQIKMKINILDRITLNETKIIDDEIDPSIGGPHSNRFSKYEYSIRHLKHHHQTFDYSRKIR